MDRLRAIVNFVLAVGQIAAPVLLFPHGFQEEVGRASDPTPIVPAEYAFAIWGVIFLGALAQSIVGLLPRWVRDPLFRRIGWLTAATYAASILWMVIATTGPNWLTVPIIVVMLAAVGPAFLLAARSPSASRPLVRWLVVVPLALYAGWLSVAVFANVSEVLAAVDVAWFTRDLTRSTLVLLTLATLLAVLGIVSSRGSIAYAATVAWALVAIVVANGSSLVGWVAAAYVLVAALAVGVRRVRPPLPA